MEVVEVEVTRRVVAVEVAVRDPGLGIDDGEADQCNSSGHEGDARQPPPVTERPRDHDRQNDEAEPPLEDVDEEPQRGEAVGVLVDAHAPQRGRDHEQGEAAQQADRGEEPASVSGSLARASGRDPHHEHRQGGGEGQLPEALVDVVGIGQSGGGLDVVPPTDERARLGRDEGQEDGVHHQDRHQPLEPVGQRCRPPVPQHLHVRGVEGEVRRTERGREHETGEEGPPDQVVEGEGRHQMVDPGPEDGVGAREDRAEDPQAQQRPDDGPHQGRRTGSGPGDAQGPAEPRQATQRGQRPGEPGQHDAGHGARAGDAAEEHGRGGHHAEHLDPPGVEQGHRQHEQECQRTAQQGPRLAAAASSDQCCDPAGDEDERPGDAHGGERQRCSGQNSRQGGCHHRPQPGPEPRLRPEPAEEHVHAGLVPPRLGGRDRGER